MANWVHVYCDVCGSGEEIARLDRECIESDNPVLYGFKMEMDGNLTHIAKLCGDYRYDFPVGEFVELAYKFPNLVFNCVFFEDCANFCGRAIFNIANGTHIYETRPVEFMCDWYDENKHNEFPPNKMAICRNGVWETLIDK